MHSGSSSRRRGRASRYGGHVRATESATETVELARALGVLRGRGRGGGGGSGGGGGGGWAQAREGERHVVGRLEAELVDAAALEAWRAGLGRRPPALARASCPVPHYWGDAAQACRDVTHSLAPLVRGTCVDVPLSLTELGGGGGGGAGGSSVAGERLERRRRPHQAQRPQRTLRCRLVLSACEGAIERVDGASLPSLERYVGWRVASVDGEAAPSGDAAYALLEAALQRGGTAASAASEVQGEDKVAAAAAAASAVLATSGRDAGGARLDERRQVAVAELTGEEVLAASAAAAGATGSLSLSSAGVSEAQTPAGTPAATDGGGVSRGGGGGVTLRLQHSVVQAAEAYVTCDGTVGLQLAMKPAAAAGPPVARQTLLVTGRGRCPGSVVLGFPSGVPVCGVASWGSRSGNGDGDDGGGEGDEAASLPSHVTVTAPHPASTRRCPAEGARAAAAAAASSLPSLEQQERSPLSSSAPPPPPPGGLLPPSPTTSKHRHYEVQVSFEGRLLCSEAAAAGKALEAAMWRAFALPGSPSAAAAASTVAGGGGGGPLRSLIAPSRAVLYTRRLCEESRPGRSLWRTDLCDVSVTRPPGSVLRRPVFELIAVGVPAAASGAGSPPPADVLLASAEQALVAALGPEAAAAAGPVRVCVTGLERPVSAGLEAAATGRGVGGGGSLVTHDTANRGTVREEDVLRVRGVFDAIDGDGSGHLSLKELISFSAAHPRAVPNTVFKYVGAGDAQIGFVDLLRCHFPKCSAAHIEHAVELWSPKVETDNAPPLSAGTLREVRAVFAALSAQDGGDVIRPASVARILEDAAPPCFADAPLTVQDFVALVGPFFSSPSEMSQLSTLAQKKRFANVDWTSLFPGGSASTYLDAPYNRDVGKQYR